MKKTIFALILIVGILFAVFAQNAGPMDLVLLLDASASMSNSYRETSDYLIGPFLREFLRIGDTIHLISFAETPRLEITRRIGQAGDVESVIGRLLLIYPLDPKTDVNAALRFAEQYVSSLPGNRQRKIILVTDGDSPDTQSLVNDASPRLKNLNADLQYIRVPVTGTGPSSGRPPAQTAQAAPPAITPPASVTQAQTPPQAVQPQQTQPQTQQPPGSPQQTQPSSQTTPPVQPSAQTPVQGGATPPAQTAAPPGVPSSQPSPGAIAPDQPGGALPPQSAAQGTTVPGVSTGTASQAEGAPGSQQPAQSGQTSQQGQPSTGAPAQGQPSTGPSSAQTQAQRPVQASSGGASLIPVDIPLPLLIALGVLALSLLGFLIFFAARRLHNSPNRAMAQAKAPPLEHPPQSLKPLPKDTIYTEPFDGPLMLNLFVEDQNTAIGRRNIHVVKSGYSFSIGGGKSDFLVFLVPVPPHIADVHYDGRNCTFIPRKPQFFPDIGSQQVPNCIGKTIRVISDMNYELHIRIERYQDPLAALNKMLNSIMMPGEVK
jgi:hypothetical protein